MDKETAIVQVLQKVLAHRLGFTEGESSGHLGGREGSPGCLGTRRGTGRRRRVGRPIPQEPGPGVQPLVLAALPEALQGGRGGGGG